MIDTVRIQGTLSIHQEEQRVSKRTTAGPRHGSILTYKHYFRRHYICPCGWDFCVIFLLTENSSFAPGKSSPRCLSWMFPGAV